MSGLLDLMRRYLVLIGLLALVPSTASAQSMLLACQRTLYANSETTEDGRTILLGDAGHPVVIECGGTTISADSIGEQGGNMVLASGNVLIEQTGLRITASRAELNLLSQMGTFYDAHGFLRVGEEATAGPLGTQKSDMEFFAAKLEKVGARTYRMTEGRFTACAQPTPRWQFTTSSGTITLDKRALLRNAVLQVKGVPLFYVPFLYYPIDSQDRSTGFLMPSYGNSNVKGTSLSNAFFWAISRSMDATFFHDWFTKAGTGMGGEYRYTTAPGSEGSVRFYALDENPLLARDGSVLRPASRSYDLRGGVNQALPRGFRLVGRVNYFSDVTAQQFYQQDVYALSNRTRHLNGTVTGGFGRYRLNATTDLRDAFSGTRASRFGRAPELSLTVADKPIGRSPIYFGANAQGAYLIRQDDLDNPASDRSLLRLDAMPRVRAPLSKLSFLTATATASWRVTHWFESIDREADAQVPVALTRHLFELRTDVVGPVFARVFSTPDNGYAERFKHLIEPFMNLQWFSPFERREQVVQIDGLDTLVGGSAQVTYGVTNRLLARRRMGENNSVVRDILSVVVRQSYYTDLRRAALDSQFSSAGPGGQSLFSAVEIRADFRPTDELTAQFRTEIDPEFRTPRFYSLSATRTRELWQVRAGWSKRRLIPGHPDFSDPNRADHSLDASTNIRTRSGRTGGSYAFNYDVRNGQFVLQRLTAYYNAQCCGISFDYQTISPVNFSFGQRPADRRFGISFSLAGLASFANPLGSFGR